MRCPPPLVPGAKLRIVAPSSPFNRTAFFRGLGFLAQRYRLSYDRRLFDREDYLAGSDDERRRELQAAIDDRDAGAIVAARGGYGASRICHQIDFTPLEHDPRWVVGFSDVTALHVELTARGICSYHAPNVSGLGRGDAATRQGWCDALERPDREATFAGLVAVQSGRGAGPLAGGNLSLLAACAAAGRLRLPRGCVLFVEDVGEAPYRLDRLLTSLLVGKHLDGVAAVVIGELVDCFPPGRPEKAAEAIRRALAPLGVVVLMGVPAGHGATNHPLLLGSMARVCSERQRLSLAAPRPG